MIQPAIPILSPFYTSTLIDPYSRNDVSDGRREFKVRQNIWACERVFCIRFVLQNAQTAERKSDEVDIIDQPISNQAQANEPISRDTNEKPEEGKSPIPLNEYGFPPSLIPLQKYPSYPFNYPFIYDSYGNFQAVQQYPVLPPSFYPQHEHQLPPIEQPMFTVGARKLDQEPSRDEKSLPVNENSLPAIPNNAIKNNANRNADIPDVAIPPIPFSFKN